MAADLTSGVVSLYATGWAFAALKENGQVVAWGNPTYGGNPQNVKLALASNVKSVHTDYHGFVAVTNGGTVVMWGKQSGKTGGSGGGPLDGYVYRGTDIDSTTRELAKEWAFLPGSTQTKDCYSSSSSSCSGRGQQASTSIIIIVCVVGVVLFAAVAFLIRKRFVATHQHHRASMPGLEKETQESA